MGMNDGTKGTSLEPVSENNVKVRPGTVKSGPTAARACDACAALKEKCLRPIPTQPCHRCTRLRKACLSNRPIKPAGRKRLLPPARSKNILAAASSQQKDVMDVKPYSLHPFGTLFSALTRQEEQIVQQLVNPSNFTQLMVMPRIGREMHREAVQVFVRWFEDLREGCFSMYAAFASAVAGGGGGKCLDEGDDGSLRSATKALKRFSELEGPEDQDDFGRWIWLGLSVAIYAHCALGSPAAPVRRTILTHLVALGEKGKEMRKHPLVVSFTVLDIFESLIYRRRPIGDLDEGCVVGLESFPGLASGLVRFAYRICLLNAVDEEEGNERVTTGADELHDKFRALDVLNSEISAWQPSPSPSDLAGCSPIEASHILTRTRTHKSALLLYIHRILHPFGSQDATADALASGIFSDLDLATATTGRPSSWVSVPFLFAGIEARDAVARERVLEGVEKYVDSISPKAREMTREFLKAMWEMRDAVPEGWRWMDWTAELPQLCVYI